MRALPVSTSFVTPPTSGSGCREANSRSPSFLQDRTFHKDGSLAYTMTDREGEDTPVVNGKAYPYLDIEPRRYRLRILNASNERFWRLRFDVDPRDAILEPHCRSG